MPSYHVKRLAFPTSGRFSITILVTIESGVDEKFHASYLISKRTASLQ